MIQWARSYNAIFNKQYLWIGAPIVATVILFVGLFLLITGYNDYLSMKRAGNEYVKSRKSVHFLQAHRR